jgi:hypothetical protein
VRELEDLGAGLGSQNGRRRRSGRGVLVLCLWSHRRTFLGRTGGPSHLVVATDCLHVRLSQIAFATLASTLTIYLTSSTSVYSSKDSLSVPHPDSTPPHESSSKYGATDDAAATAPPAVEVPVLKQRPRKTLYFVRPSPSRSFECTDAVVLNRPLVQVFPKSRYALPFSHPPCSC